jgi:hypothetical protein
VYKAATKAQRLQRTDDLSKIQISANDEVFDGSKPILTAVCTNSLFCPLLKKSDNRKTGVVQTQVNKHSNTFKISR